MAVFEILSILAIVAAIIYWFATRHNRYWEKRGIAFEPPVPFFGNFLDAILAKRSQPQVACDIHKKWRGEKVVGVFNFTSPALLIRDPELVQKILVTDFHKFPNNSLEIDENVDPILGRNMFVQRGERWKRTRQAMSPAFTIGRIKPTFDTVKEVIGKFMTYLEEHPEGEAKATLALFTSEIVASWGIGIDGHSFTEPDPILPKLGRMIFQPSLSAVLKFMAFTMAPALSRILRLKFVPDEVPAFFDTMLRDMIQQRQKSPEVRKDFLQYYIDLRKKRQIKINDDQNDVTEDDIVAGIVSFFVEGYETSSIISSFLVYHLGLDPKIQTELRAEVDGIFAKSNNDPTLESILDAPYLGQVYSETLRLYGAMLMSKQASEDCDLDVGKGKPLRIEKGMDILIPLHGIQTDPEYWEDPYKFDPNRFTEENKAARIRGIYFPFGDGPRMCIGMRMASTMIKTVIVYLVRNFYIDLDERTERKYVQDPKHFISLQKGGIHMKLSKRK